MKVIARLLRRIALLAVALAAFAIIALVTKTWLTSPDFAEIRFDEYSWAATQAGFAAQDVSKRDQRICICQAYECDSEYSRAETVNIAYEGWLRRSHVVVRDPLRNDPDWGRMVWANSICVKKLEGEILALTLTEFSGLDSAGAKTVNYLRLEIE